MAETRKATEAPEATKIPSHQRTTVIEVREPVRTTEHPVSFLQWKLQEGRADPPVPDESSSLDEVTGYTTKFPWISKSSIRCWRSCPRRFLFRYRLGIARKSQPRSDALDTGIIWHVFMAARYAGQTQEQAEADILNWWDEQVQGSEWKDDVTEREMEFTKFRQRLLLAQAMADVWHETTRSASVDRMKVLAVEQHVRIKRNPLGQYIHGILDAVLDDGEGLWIVDNKTTGKSPRIQSLGASFSLEVRLYRLLAEAAYPDRKILGFIHNIIQKPTIRLSAEDRPFEEVSHTLKSGPRKGQVVTRKEFYGEPMYENYVERVRDWYVGRGRYAHLGPDRVENPALLESWTVLLEEREPPELSVILTEVAKAGRANPDLNRYYRNCGSCVNLFDTCEFLPLCGSHPATWKPLIQENYMPRRSGAERAT